MKAGQLFIQVLIPCVVLAAAFFVYRPGLGGGFVFDDYSSILKNDALKIETPGAEELIEAATSGYSGPLGRPVSMLSFGLNVYSTGLDPYFFKLTNLLIHLLNGVLIYLLTVQLLEAGLKTAREHGSDADHRLVAWAVTAAWLLHPVNLIGVLYIVQRMNLLSALFTVLGLIAYLAGRQRQMKGESGAVCIFVSIVVCGGMAVLSKENGVLLIVYLFVIEFVILGLDSRRASARTGLTLFFVLVASVFIAGLVTLLVVNPEFLSAGYEGRGFTLVERLLTEARVLWFYLYLICLPNIRQMALFHDDMALSIGLFEPATTLPALLGIAGLLAAAVVIRKRLPVAAFGILFFLAGHSLESTILPLEIAHEYRNYLPSYGIILVIFYYLLKPGRRLKYAGYGRLAAVLLISAFAFGTLVRAHQWGDPVLLRFHELNRNPESARANYEIGRFYAIALDAGNVDDREGIYTEAEYYFKRALGLRPGNLEALAGLIILGSSNGRSVPDRWKDALLFHLENSPLNYTGIESLRALLTCIGMQECIIGRDYADALIRSALENGKLAGHRAALTYHYASLFYSEYGNDYDAARTLAELAVAAKSEDLNLRLRLAALYIRLNRFDKAKLQLEAVRRHDRLNLHEEKTAALERMMSMRDAE